MEAMYQLKFFLEENKRNPHYPPELYSNIASIRKYSSQADLKNLFKLDQNLFNFISFKLPSSHADFFSNVNKS